MKKQENEFKLKGFSSFIFEFIGWLSITMFFAGIWINEYRWKLIFTSLFLFTFISLYYFAKKSIWEDKNERNS